MAINGNELMVFERNIRGVGVDSDPASPNKNEFVLDLTGATDATGMDLRCRRRGVYRGEQNRHTVYRSCGEHAG